MMVARDRLGLVRAAAPTRSDHDDRVKRPARPTGSGDIHESATSGVHDMEPTEIVLTIPGRPDFLRLARMAAADAASRVGLTYEEIDDLRIAVDELCFAVMGEDGTSAPLTLVYQIHPDAVGVRGSCPAPSNGASPAQSELSRTIVAAVVDEHELGNENGARCFRLLKRGTAQDAATAG
jgi:hypothetical protein